MLLDQRRNDLRAHVGRKFAEFSCIDRTALVGAAFHDQQVLVEQEDRVLCLDGFTLDRSSLALALDFLQACV
jgi:hypothetical protein